MHHAYLLNKRYLTDRQCAVRVERHSDSDATPERQRVNDDLANELCLAAGIPLKAERLVMRRGRPHGRLGVRQVNGSCDFHTAAPLQTVRVGCGGTILKKKN